MTLHLTCAQLRGGWDDDECCVVLGWTQTKTVLRLHPRILSHIEHGASLLFHPKANPALLAGLVTQGKEGPKLSFPSSGGKIDPPLRNSMFLSQIQ